jgi:hypothetical protein
MEVQHNLAHLRLVVVQAKYLRQHFLLFRERGRLAQVFGFVFVELFVEEEVASLGFLRHIRCYILIVE